MLIADGILLAAAIIAAIPWMTLAIEAFASLWPRRHQSFLHVNRPVCAILIPAHNESAGIAATVANAQDQCDPLDRIVVVADNCTDDTAHRAREAGALVVERQDAERRGKGFALECGVSHLAADKAPEILVIVDADCLLGPDCLHHLVRQAHATGRPAQGIYLIGTGREDELRRRLSAFAVLLKNQIRPLGLHRLGQPCLLTGTGMAFPWDVIASINLGSGDIVEDMKLGADLTIAGHPPQLCPEARLTGAAAPDEGSAIKQRTRWEHGHVQTMVRQVPRLLIAGLRRARITPLSLALELAVPPLSLLIVCSFILGGMCLMWWQLGQGSPWPVGVLGLAFSMAGLGLVLSWAKFARTMLPLSSLLMLPVYILWKLPIYLKMLVAREKHWVRTERSPENSLPPA